MKIPTYQRRYMLLKLKESYDERQEEIENMSQKVKGKQSFSGDALKQKLKNNEIPS